VEALSTAAEVEVREAGARDLDALVALSLAVRRTAIAWAGADWSPTALIAERMIWWDRLRDPQTWTAVATAGPTRVGAIALTRAGRGSSSGLRGAPVAYLAGPLVDPEWWHEGLGSRLVEKAESVAAALGFARAELFVEMGNGRGRHFLERHGWRRQDEGARRSPMALALYAREMAARAPAASA
jgi:GNAT superfamily N-acetyltransferase